VSGRWRSAIVGLFGGLLLQLALLNGRTLRASLGEWIRGSGLVLHSGDSGRAVVQKAAGDGSALFFLNTGGNARLQAAIYPETPANPLLALSPDDRTSNVKGLLRLAGGNHSGVVVLKDKPAGDRLVLGLNLNHPDEEPFLAYWENGRRKLLFGSF
jgi:hypothetical protein